MQGFACRIRSLNGFPRPFPIFVAEKKNSPTAADVAATSSASDSNLRCGKEEWPACYDRRDNELPRPILIFAAAKKNGPTAADVAATSSVSVSNFPSSKEEWPACSGRGSNEVRIRFKSSLRQRRTASLQLAWQQRLPRPILIFEAAKKNGPPPERACYCIDS